jgi:hypothetical protein
MKQSQLRVILLGVVAGFSLIQNSEAFENKRGSLTAKEFESTRDERDESWFESDINPFENQRLSTVDPLTQQKFHKILTGPAYYTRFRMGYDYYRYVTFYNVSIKPERAVEFTIISQSCHDTFERLATMQKSQTYRTEVKAGISWEGLGLESTMALEERAGMDFNIAAYPGGYEADHVIYYDNVNWNGFTYIQTYNSDTQKFGWIPKQEREPSLSVFSILFPNLAQHPYPIPFQVKKADRKIRDQIENLRKCDPSEVPTTQGNRNNSSAAYEN